MGVINHIASWSSMRPVDFSGKLKKGPDSTERVKDPSPDDPAILADTRGFVFPIFGVPKDGSADAQAKQKGFLLKVVASSHEVALDMHSQKPMDGIRPLDPKEIIGMVPEFADRLAAKLDRKQAPMLHPELNPDVKLENVYKLNYAIDHSKGFRLLLGTDSPAKRLRRFYTMAAVQLAAGKTSVFEIMTRLLGSRPQLNESTRLSSKTAFDGYWTAPGGELTLDSTPTRA